jgi:hypothetical protein
MGPPGAPPADGRKKRNLVSWGREERVRNGGGRRGVTLERASRQAIGAGYAAGDPSRRAGGRRREAERSTEEEEEEAEEQ